MKLRDFQLYSCVSSKGDIMRIQHGHESQDLTKVYHGTSHRNPALGGTPGFQSQYPLLRKWEGIWQIDYLLLKESSCQYRETQIETWSQVSVETGVEAWCRDMTDTRSVHESRYSRRLTLIHSIPTVEARVRNISIHGTGFGQVKTWVKTQVET